MCCNLELNLVQILINSGLVRSYNDALNFLKSGYIYINRRVALNSSYVARSGDIIELTFSKLYYIYLLKSKSVNEKTSIKMRNKL
jgi:hypothetical protein